MCVCTCVRVCVCVCVCVWVGGCVAKLKQYLDGEKNILLLVCEDSVVAEDGTTGVQHCVESYQCVVENLQSGEEGGWEGRVRREGEKGG